MIIDRITIRDFQSIEHADLALGPWTSLVGESDVGKSAVVRALYAALTNQRGDLFIRRGADSCGVLIELTDGRAVAWSKRRGKSGEYQVIGATGDYQEFEKTGGEVPPEVAALLRVAVPVAGDQLLPGIQRQHDPPFLFADTARRRAQILGEFDGTNILLHADGDLRKKLRAEQSNATGARETAQKAEAALLEVEWVDSAAGLVAAAQRAHSAAETTGGRLDGLRASASGMAALYDALGIARATLDRTQPAPALDFDAIDQRIGHIVQMQNARGLVAFNEQKVRRAHAHPLPDVMPIQGRIDRLTGMSIAREVAAAKSVQHDQARQASASALYAAEVSAIELEELVGTACPECGQPLTADGLGVA